MILGCPYSDWYLKIILTPGMSDKEMDLIEGFAYTLKKIAGK